MAGTEHAPTDLVRALSAIRRSQQRWLADVRSVCAGDPRFLDAFRRWEEELTLIKLHLHRAEQRLLHFLMIPEEMRPWRELPGLDSDSHTTFQGWMKLVGPYFRGLHIDTRYRRLGRVLELDGEAITADVITDLVAICEVAETTGAAMDTFDRGGNRAYLEDVAFFHVLSPWKQHGMPAMLDFLRWLHEFLAEQDEL